MALLFMESFDGYGGTVSYATKWYGSRALSSSPVRTGTYAMWSEWHRNIAPGSTTLIFGGALYWQAGFDALVAIGNTAGGSTFTERMCQFSITAGGAIAVYRGYNTLLTTSAAVLVPGAWNYIEIKVNVADAGSYEVKVNGVQVLVDASEDMSSGGSIAYLAVHCNSNNRWDDLYLLDSTGTYLNDFIGDCKVECLSPQTDAVAVGSNAGLTPSTSTDHGALVDELPPNDDTDYNYGVAAGLKDTYNYPSVATTGVVYAVQATARVKKSDSATKTFAQVARVGGSDYDGATTTLATGYGEFQQIWEKRPSDNSDWTTSDVNAAEFGLKVVA